MNLLLGDTPLGHNPDLLDQYLHNAIMIDGLNHINTVLGMSIPVTSIGTIFTNAPPLQMPFIQYGTIDEWLPYLNTTNESHQIQSLLYQDVLLVSSTTTGGTLTGNLLIDRSQNFDALGVTPEMFVQSVNNTQINWPIQTYYRVQSYCWALTEGLFFDPAGGEPYKIYKFKQQYQYNVPRKVPVQVDFYGKDIEEARHLAEAFREYLNTRLINDTFDNTAAARQTAGKDGFVAKFIEVSRVIPTDYPRADGKGYWRRRSLTFVFRIDEWMFRDSMILPV